MKRSPLLGLIPLALLVAGALVLEQPSEGVAPEGVCVEEFEQGIGGAPFALTLGPDRRLWFTEQLDDRIGVLDPRTGRAQEIPVPADTQPNAIAAGPDGKLWFTGLMNAIGTVDPRTRKVEIVVQDEVPPGSIPQHIVSAPDGNLYISLQEAGFLARVEPRSGKFTLLPLEGVPPVSRPNGIALDPDRRHFWVALQNGDGIARFDFRAGKVDKFVKFSASSGPAKLTFGPEGKIYVTLQYASAVGIYDPRSDETEEFPSGLPEPRTPDFAPGPKIVDVIPDPEGGGIWISTSAVSRLFRFDTEDQRITRLDCGITPKSGTLALTRGPDGKIWFSQPLDDQGRLGRVDQ